MNAKQRRVARRKPRTITTGWIPFTSINRMPPEPARLRGVFVEASVPITAELILEGIEKIMRRCGR